MEDRINNLTRISVPTLGGFIFIYVSDIIFCEGAGNYANKPILVTLLLAELEIKLMNYQSFLRIHNSYIANLNFADHYEKGKDGTLFLNDKIKTRLTVSRTHKKEFLEKWKTKE